MTPFVVCSSLFWEKGELFWESLGFAIVLGTGHVDSTGGQWGDVLITFSDPLPSQGGSE